VSAGYDALRTEWEVVVGLETHVELGTRTKMFCGCSTELGAPPNSQVCPTCLGLPGALPVLNELAVELTVRIGLALHCDIAPWCRFARKNYFYPDQPKDFQISQYDEPLCVDGYLDVDDPETGELVRVGIERAHMEEDTGKTLHVGGATGRIHGATHSLVDYNRAGIPLVEIVTRPDIRSAAVARAYVGELREVLRSIGASAARMEQGQLRCDANTSVRRLGQPLGTRTETKNVNSLRAVERAVRGEVERQVVVLGGGGAVKQETRHFDETTGLTRPGRSKEEATDYRYFPEPDLTPLAVDDEYVSRIRESLPELPRERRARLAEVLGFDALALGQMSSAGVLDLVQETAALGADPAAAQAVWMNDLAALANERDLETGELGVSAPDVARVLELRADGTLSAALVRQVLTAVADGEGGPDTVVEARGLRALSDSGELQGLVDAAITANPDAVASIRAGKLGAVGQIMGAVMKASRGQADGKATTALIRSTLGVG